MLIITLATIAAIGLAAIAWFICGIIFAGSDNKWDCERAQFESDMAARIYYGSQPTIDSLLDDTIEPHKELARIEAQLRQLLELPVGDTSPLGDALLAAVYDSRDWPGFRERCETRLRALKGKLTERVV